MDAHGNALVVFVGESPGEFAAQWFAPGARPSTRLFTFLGGVRSGPHTWIELTPAVDGGLLVTRAALSTSTADARTEHLCQIHPGATTCLPAPAWMQTRPDTRLRTIRGGRAWAAFSTLRHAVDCANKIEILAADGTSCAQMELRIAPGLCHLLDLAIGPEGTVVQTLPREVALPNGDNVVWRWWPRLLR